jgi:TolA-binding protein
MPAAFTLRCVSHDSAVARFHALADLSSLPQWATRPVPSLLEDAFGKEALHGPPNPVGQRHQIKDLSAQMTRLEAQIEKLRAEVSQLRERNFQLGHRNAEFEALVVKDSHNSSRPPSTDPPWGKRTKSMRRPSGRRPGSEDTVERRCTSGRALTASSSTDPASAGVVAPRCWPLGSCAITGSN